MSYYSTILRQPTIKKKLVKQIEKDMAELIATSNERYVEKFIKEIECVDDMGNIGFYDSCANFSGEPDFSSWIAKYVKDGQLLLQGEGGELYGSVFINGLAYSFGEQFYAMHCLNKDNVKINEDTIAAFNAGLKSVMEG